MTGCSRVTARRYIEAAQKQGLATAVLEFGDDQLAQLAALDLPGMRRSQTSTATVLEEHTGRIGKQLTQDTLQLTRIHDLLIQRGCHTSYTSLRRFCVSKSLRRRRSALTIRMAERSPGEAAEVEFARLGPGYDRDRFRNPTVWR